MRVNFAEISEKRYVRFVCPGCGKRRSRTKKFYQTLNPFNLAVDGQPKTEDQIRREVRAQAAAWKPICADCERGET